MAMSSYFSNLWSAYKIIIKISYFLWFIVILFNSFLLFLINIYIFLINLRNDFFYGYMHSKAIFAYCIANWAHFIWDEHKSFNMTPFLWQLSFPSIEENSLFNEQLSFKKKNYQNWFCKNIRPGPDWLKKKNPGPLNI